MVSEEVNNLDYYDKFYYNEELLSIPNKQGSFKTPQVVLFDNSEYKISMENLVFKQYNGKFNLDEKLRSFTDESYQNFINEHNSGIRLFNGTNLRLFQVVKYKDKLELGVQDVGYFDCIRTNLIIDKVNIDEKSTLREYLHKEGRLDDLNNSKLGNQLGTSILLLTGEGDIVVQERSDKVLVWPNTLGPSGSGSVEPCDIENNDFAYKELLEELGIERNEIEKGIFLGITRELVRGGKPELFFLATTYLSNEEIVNRRNKSKDRWENTGLQFIKFSSLKKKYTFSEVIDKDLFLQDINIFLEGNLNRISIPLMGNLALLARWIIGGDLSELFNIDYNIEDLFSILCKNKHNLNKDIIVKYLEKLPDERKREYEIKIDQLLRLEVDNGLERFFIEIMESDHLELIRYASFYALCTILRRQKDFTKYEDLIDKYRDDFSSRITFYHLESMCLRELNDNIHLKKSIEIAKKAKDEVYTHVGIQHSYAIVIAMAFEEDIYSLENEDNRIELYEALRISEEITKKEPNFAKFYSTYGRLLCINEEYDKAKENLRIAIDKEDRDKHGYVLKIGDYQAQLLNMNFYKNRKELKGIKEELENKVSVIKQEIDEATDKLDREKTSNLEFLGFFTAMISFTIGSIQVTSGQAFEDAVSLIIVLAGSLLIVLGGFGTILHGNSKLKRNIITWSMGIAMILLAVFYI